MDLSILMVHYVDLPHLQQFYPSIIEGLSHTDKTIQKKCYRVLEEMSGSDSVACRHLIAEKLGELQKHLAESLSSSSPSSKAPRLRCLIRILSKLEEPNMEFLNTVVPEAVLCTKEVAEKARTAAYNLLTTICETLCRWKEATQTKQETLYQVFEMLLAGLAGSPHMVSCTVLAITKMLKDFRQDLDKALLTLLVDATCLLLKSKAREIVTTAVGLMKMLLGIVPESDLAQFLQQIVSSLVTMKEDNKHHLRFHNKVIYAKLIRKFGYEHILKLVPQSHHKILQNIKKTTDRKKRKQEAEQGELEDDGSDDDAVEQMRKAKPETVADYLIETDSEDDEEAEDKKKKQKSGKKRKAQDTAYIKEGGDEDVVDFLDTTVSKRVTSTKPSKVTATKIKHDFKTTSDGRLVINFDEEDEDDGQKRGKKRRKDDDDDDDLADLFAALSNGKKSNKKIAAMENDEDEEMVESTYKPGGKGIHRANPQESIQSGQEYKAKKAKGDVKKQGQQDPYAYIPLDRNVMNKRKKAKLQGTFKNFVKGANKGASKGKKMRMKKK